jgi:hypothetical protein
LHPKVPTISAIYTFFGYLNIQTERAPPKSVSRPHPPPPTRVRLRPLRRSPHGADFGHYAAQPRPPKTAPPPASTGPTSAPMPHNQGRSKLRLRPPPRGRLRPQAVLPAHATHRDTPAKSFSGTPLVLARVDAVRRPAALCPFLCSICTLPQFGERRCQNRGAWSAAHDRSSLRTAKLHYQRTHTSPTTLKLFRQYRTVLSGRGGGH